MALEIHAKCRSRLQEALIAGLLTLRVENGMFVDRATSFLLVEQAEPALPMKGPLRDNLLEYIDEHPLTEFVLSTIGLELSERADYRKESNDSLVDLAGYRDVQELAGRLLDAFETLPWNYRIFVPLPDALAELLKPQEDQLALSPNVQIVRATEEFLERFPPKERHRGDDAKPSSLAALMASLEQVPALTGGRLYLQVAVKGYVGQYGSTAPAVGVDRLVRSFLGAGLATGLFDHKSVWNRNPVSTPVSVYKEAAAGTWEAITRYNLDDEFSRALDGIEFLDLSEVDTNYLRVWRRGKLLQIGSALQAGATADPTLLASQWFFNGSLNRDELLSFVQLMVVLEIMLGDSKANDMLGIGQLISNRFAYLIGTTPAERAEYIALFSQIYEVRSRIVHSGKHRLSFRERMLFGRLQWMCRRVITKELELLHAAAEKAKKQPVTK